MVSLVMIPTHYIVVISAWVARFVAVFVQIASVRVITDMLGMDRYAVFVLLTGLVGWYSLTEMGIGASLQNHISEWRARNNSNSGYSSYIAIAGLLVVLLYISSIAILYVASPYIAPVFLKNFNFLTKSEMVRDFFSVGVILTGTAMGGIAYKIWFAEHKGYLSNILPAIASVAGLIGVMSLRGYDGQDKLHVLLIAFLAPSALLPLTVLCVRFIFCLREGIEIRSSDLRLLINRAIQFWFLGLLAAGVFQMDYIIMSQYVSSKDIASYNIVTKIFGLVHFLYGAILVALWPIFAEEIVKRNYSVVTSHIKKCLAIGIIFMLISTFCIAYGMPYILKLLAPTLEISIPVSFILLLGAYYLIRIWTDIYATVLQSMSQLRSFWLYVPIQALINISLQVLLVPLYGLYGIPVGLIISFVLTAVWILPLAVKKHWGDSMVGVV
jgi:O-antigen/teichoic acid export membrane protein